ncbi:hypothetical protein ABTM55_19530, partial [Acinetobacter baumannii]
PCLSEITVDDIMAGVTAVFERWPQLRPKGLTVSSFPASESGAIVEASGSEVGRLARAELVVLTN